jgi:hypothetical protein
MRSWPKRGRLGRPVNVRVGVFFILEIIIRESWVPLSFFES